MARPKQSIIEYRSYDFPGSLPVQIHNRMNWRISSVKSSRLHIQNCFLDVPSYILTLTLIITFTCHHHDLKWSSS